MKKDDRIKEKCADGLIPVLTCTLTLYHFPLEFTTAISDIISLKMQSYKFDMFRPKIQLYTVHLTSLSGPSTTPSVLSKFQSAVYLASLSNGPGSTFKRSSTTRRIYV